MVNRDMDALRRARDRFEELGARARNIGQVIQFQRPEVDIQFGGLFEFTAHGVDCLIEDRTRIRLPYHSRPDALIRARVSDAVDRNWARQQGDPQHLLDLGRVQIDWFMPEGAEPPPDWRGWLEGAAAAAWDAIAGSAELRRRLSAPPYFDLSRFQPTETHAKAGAWWRAVHAFCWSLPPGDALRIRRFAMAPGQFASAAASSAFGAEVVPLDGSAPTRPGFSGMSAEESYRSILDRHGASEDDEREPIAPDSPWRLWPPPIVRSRLDRDAADAAIAVLDRVLEEQPVRHPVEVFSPPHPCVAPSLDDVERERERFASFVRDRKANAPYRMRRVLRWILRSIESDPLGERVFTPDPEQMNRTLRGKVFRLMIGRAGAEGRAGKPRMNALVQRAKLAWRNALGWNIQRPLFGGRSFSLDLWPPYSNHAPFTRFYYEPVAPGCEPLDKRKLARGPDEWMREAKPDEGQIRRDLFAWATRWQAAADALIAGDAATLRVMQALEKRGGNTRWTPELAKEAMKVKEAGAAWMTEESRAFIDAEHARSVTIVHADTAPPSVLFPGSKPHGSPSAAALRLLDRLSDQHASPDARIAPASLSEPERRLLQQLWLHRLVEQPLPANLDEEADAPIVYRVADAGRRQAEFRRSLRGQQEPNVPERSAQAIPATPEELPVPSNEAIAVLRYLSTRSGRTKQTEIAAAIDAPDDMPTSRGAIGKAVVELRDAKLIDAPPNGRKGIAVLEAGRQFLAKSDGEALPLPQRGRK